MEQIEQSVSFPISATVETTKTNHLDVLLAIRAIACFFVVIAHCSPPRDAIVFQGYDLSWLLFAAGGMYLRTFFCLSGYLMGKLFYTGRYQLSLDGILKFWRNRVLRVFPLYYFAALFLIIFVYTGLLKLENWGYLIRIFTFTYNHALPPDFNRPLWSLSTEVQFYLLAPFIYSFVRERCTKTRQIYIAAIIIILFTTLLRLPVWITDLKSDVITYWYTPLAANLDMFMCGFLLNPLIKYNQEKRHLKTHDLNQSLNQLEVLPDGDRGNGVKTSLFFKSNFKSKSNSPNWLEKFIAVSLMIAFHFYTAYHVYHHEMRNIAGAETGIKTSMSFFILPIITALLVSFLIYSFESGASYLGHLSNEKLSIHTCIRNPIRLIEIFGYLSYGIYVWHMPIIRQITPILTSKIPLEVFLTKAGVVVMLCTLVATVTYYLVELPAARWRFGEK
jgi:peptidoglycan/LPS O-acetylase OafA/YrhL